jgi:hypothetical protein
MPSELIIQIAGAIPAIIFPAGSITQLYAIVSRRSATGVSALTWFFAGFANICLYVYTQKYGEWESIVAFLFSSILNFTICGMAIYYRRRTSKVEA